MLKRHNCQEGEEAGPVISWGFAVKPKDLPDQALWDLPIPLVRPDLSPEVPFPWTYRRYFLAIQRELSRHEYAVLRETLNRKGSGRTGPRDWEALHIIAEKHGNYYHPARIEVVTRKEILRFVMNVALTEWGKALIPQEVRALILLSRKYSYPFIPQVLFHSAFSSDPSGLNEGGEQALCFFVADWFEGFHEFHWSLDPQSGQRRLLLWDGGVNPSFLSRAEEEQILMEAAKILTLYYDHGTYEQIYPWHHGAGDFVARVGGGEVEVKLVTVRQYGPMIEPKKAQPIEALLFFFLNLSLRMRLDRLDGIGEKIWAEEHSLAATWRGFLEALEVKKKAGDLDSAFLDRFFREAARLSLKDLAERFSALLKAYNPQAPDLPVIRENIIPHILLVHQLLTGGQRP